MWFSHSAIEVEARQPKLASRDLPFFSSRGRTVLVCTESVELEEEARVKKQGVVIAVTRRAMSEGSDREDAFRDRWSGWPSSYLSDRGRSKEILVVAETTTVGPQRGMKMIGRNRECRNTALGRGGGLPLGWRWTCALAWESAAGSGSVPAAAKSGPGKRDCLDRKKGMSVCSVDRSRGIDDR